MILLLAYTVVFIPPEEQLPKWDATYEFMRQRYFSVSHLFQFADHWNWLLITFSGSLTIYLLCINEGILRRVLAKWSLLTPDTFFGGGFLWLTRMVINLGLLLMEILLISYLCNFLVAAPIIYNHESLPAKQSYSILLLGTSKYLRGTTQYNMYYQQRISTTVDLYKKYTIEKIIISGDHQGLHYSEPEDMKRDLLHKGIPASRIILDLKGFRTFDSIKRAKALQGRSRTLLVVSQYFHLERALYLAQANRVDAMGVAAEGNLTWQMMKRELFAKTRVLLDVYFFNTQATGIAAHPRRSICLRCSADISLLFFVLLSAWMAGRLSRVLLQY